MEFLASLADPVVMPVGRDRSPILDASDRPRLAQDRQLLLTFEIVADIAVEDAAAVMKGFRVPDQDRDRDRRTGALTEYLASLLSRTFALRPLVSP